MLRMMGKGSKNLVTKDVVDWGYRMPEPGEPEVIHEDTWAAFCYIALRKIIYLDVNYWQVVLCIHTRRMNMEIMFQSLRLITMMNTVLCTSD